MTPEQELDFRMLEPQERGEIIRLAVAYPESPKTYVYAAVNVNEVWYLTGADGGDGRSWVALLNWLKNKNATLVSLRRAVSWEDLL